MMKWMFSGLILAAMLFGALNGRLGEVTNAALSECGNAVQLCITLTGAMCMWNGLMKIAEKSRLTEKMSVIFGPVLGLLFKGLDRRGPAMRAIMMNVTANLLGLGNAATPLGINAMKELDKLNLGSGIASDHMILFVVINTASLQLVPTTAAMLRAKAGSQTPLDILPAVLCSSLVSLVAGIAAAKLPGKLIKRKAAPITVRKSKIPLQEAAK